jgi:hypothetical protein
VDWCVHIAGPADLEGDPVLSQSAAWEPSAKLRPRLERAVAKIIEGFGDVRFSRCVFGTEFCEYLMPSPVQVAEAARAARERGLAFTLVTPYVSDAGVACLGEIFEWLREGEVVFNDWGILNLLRREFPRITPVQGRLLNKSLRDPRVMGVYGETEVNATLAALQRSSIDNESYTSLLARFGVEAVEMDNLPQGMDLSFADRVRVTVYLPFGFIATSRVCMAAGLHYRKADKFQPGAPCRHECQTHLVEFKYTTSPFSNRDQTFLLKGNSYFYLHDDSMLNALFDHARSGHVSRLVFQPRLPMVMS